MKQAAASLDIFVIYDRARRTGTAPGTDPSPGDAPSGHEAIPSGFEVVVNGGRRPVGLDAVAWAVRAVELGAGELLVTGYYTFGPALAHAIRPSDTLLAGWQVCRRWLLLVVVLVPA